MFIDLTKGAWQIIIIKTSNFQNWTCCCNPNTGNIIKKNEPY